MIEQRLRESEAVLRIFTPHRLSREMCALVTHDPQLELNKSLHRIEVVPYDVLGQRAEAVLRNVDLYMGATGQGDDET